MATGVYIPDALSNLNFFHHSHPLIQLCFQISAETGSGEMIAPGN